MKAEAFTTQGRTTRAAHPAQFGRKTRPKRPNPDRRHLDHPDDPDSSLLTQQAARDLETYEAVVTVSPITYIASVFLDVFGRLLKY